MTIERRTLELALAAQAIRIGGPFRLKSGALSPLFFDSSRFHHAHHLERLSDLMVERLAEQYSLDEIDVLFGPAYKGIPLATACALGCARRSSQPIQLLFDRKEAKAHGEHTGAGTLATRLMGDPPAAESRVIIVDDVITTAGTKHEAITLLRHVIPGVKILALLVMFDREESVEGKTQSALFEAQTGIPVLSLLRARRLPELLTHDDRISPSNYTILCNYFATTSVTQ